MTDKSCRTVTFGLLLSLACLNAWASCDPVADAKAATPAMPVTMEYDVEILTSTGGGEMYMGSRIKKGTKLASPFKLDRVPKGERVIVRYVEPACGWTKKKVIFIEDIWSTIGQKPSPAQNKPQ
jgi:hypothetical protein